MYKYAMHRVDELKALLNLYNNAGISKDSEVYKHTEWKLDCLFYAVGLK